MPVTLEDLAAQHEEMLEEITAQHGAILALGAAIVTGNEQQLEYQKVIVTLAAQVLALGRNVEGLADAGLLHLEAQRTVRDALHDLVELLHPRSPSRGRRPAHLSIVKPEPDDPKPA